MSLKFYVVSFSFLQVGKRFQITMLNILLFFFFFLPFLIGNNRICVAANTGFVGRNGTQFVLNGEQVYLNGFNAYWMMTTAADTAAKGRGIVTTALRQASAVGMNVARIWGFNEGDYIPLQISPGSYSEDVFKGLDFVVYEAGRFKIKLIISLVNNYEDYGGRKKYVEWAGLDEPDEFYTNSAVKQFYKNHVKTVLTRKNTITGRMYKDDPTIFSWELINEPRCNVTGSNILQNWVKEMASYVKSIDSIHLLEIGLEGFYGDSIPERTVYNPGGRVLTGTDFISNNQIPDIDFATIHIYPDSWLPLQSSRTGEQDTFVDRWIGSHIEDCNNIIMKPLLITEFGKSSKYPGFSLEKRNKFFKRVYDVIYDSARTGGSCTGGVFWQLTTNRTGLLGDGYEVFMQAGPNTTAQLIAEQSSKLRNLKYPPLVTHSAE
ncbi:LOW QUALITY PROTEIN: mannan endo-1,4-beta-mannosidase 1 [Arabidopsis lyrata subsp. lyrata]|nr:LOW QUALITY PROTEIN: mannan endo-1,4-beta-mannosidase 1 [Arabidopsis lyrata subsp. lyrata]|eukprot:XP_020868090.1 LOW QUALITY PROTEIN: mannan endo-1,4-beta-mannosidase 1 [Arabidopsis lyrata subsp. lyrata]